MAKQNVKPSFPTADEFRQMLLDDDLRTLAERHVLSAEVPFAFKDSPASLKTLRGHLVHELSVHAEHVIVVGSGRIGFSLSPAGFPRRFGPKSDVDIVVIDETMFDLYWHTMLTWNYPRRGTSPLAGRDSSWRRKRQRDLYWGWFRPDYIRYDGLSLPSVLRPIRDLSTTWFNAFQSLSQYPRLARRQITGRLYRTRELALLYHVDGLEKLRDVLQLKDHGTGS
jgi:hypothetical protein